MVVETKGKPIVVVEIPSTASVEETEETLNGVMAQGYYVLSIHTLEQYSGNRGVRAYFGKRKDKGLTAV